MSNVYTQNHYLKDLLSNNDFAEILPQFGLKYNEEGTKVSVRSKGTVYRQVISISSKSARPHYKNFKVKQGDFTIKLTGELKDSIELAFEDVYNALKSRVSLLTQIANNREILQKAFKDSERKFLKFGEQPKLYLREGAVANVKELTPKQQQLLAQDVMDNIRYSEQFMDIQKKLGLDQEKDYEIRKYKWQMKVGETIRVYDRGEDFNIWNRRNIL